MKRNQTLQKKAQKICQKSTADNATTLNTFMQATGQMLMANTQAIAHLEMQLGQLATTISEKVKGGLLSQHEANPRT